MKTPESEEKEIFATTNRFAEGSSRYSRNVTTGAIVCAALILTFVVCGLLWVFARAVA